MTTTDPDTGAGESGRALARAAAAAFGISGKPDVPRFYDEGEKNHVDIVVAEQTPEPGLTTWSTLSLHKTANTVDGRDIRVELLGVADDAHPAFGNVLATAAFLVIKDGWIAAPDVVFPDVVAMYDISATLRHLLLADPFLFPELGSVALAGHPDVHWLHVVPITDAERDFAVEHGADALNRLFEEQDLPYSDLARVSAV